MNDDISLEEKIAQAKLQTEQAKSANASTASQIADAQAVNRDLGAQLEALRIEREKGMRNAAYLCGLHEDNKRMQRELAASQGREYRDPDDPNYDYPEPPDDPGDP